MKYDFNYIINPITQDDFINNYYEKKPLLIKRNNPKYFTDILTIDCINNHLNQADLIYPGVRIVKEANEINPNDYTYSITTTPNKPTEGIIDKEKMFFYFYNGNTIILNSHERHSLNLLYLRHIVEEVFYTKAQANIYLTPFKSQGFKAHWDTHDVFIFQVGGTKEWKIYDSPIELPSKNKPFSESWAKTEPQLTTILEEGDLLYIPRGYVHEANSGEDISLHITLGLHTYKHADLLRLILEDIDDDLYFRKSLPIKFNINEISFIEYVQQYLLKIDLQKSISKIKDNFISKRLPDPTDRLLDYLKLNSMDASSKLQKKQSIFYDLKVTKAQVELNYCNKTIKFPIFVENDIKFILETETFQVKELNGKLDEESKIVLCKKLVEEGFLSIMD